MISLNSSMNYDIGYPNTFSSNHDEPYCQREIHSHTINRHAPLPNVYTSRTGFYPPSSDLRSHVYPVPPVSSRQLSLLPTQPTVIKDMPDTYEIYHTKEFHNQRRLSFNDYGARSRQLSRSGDCVFDPVPTYHTTSVPPVDPIPFKSSQQYLPEQSRTNSDDKSSTDISFGDSRPTIIAAPGLPVIVGNENARPGTYDMQYNQLAQPHLPSQPPTPVAGRWRSSTSPADAAICDMLYEKMSYIDENPLSQVYVNRNTGYYQRYIGSENEHTVPTTTPSPNHRPDILPPPSDSIVAHVPKPTIFDSRQCPGASLMSSFSTKASSTALKRYKCAVCSKRFTRPSSLTTHMYSHTGEKPHKCPVTSCGRRFSVVSNLRRHLKIHETEKHSELTVA